MDFAYLLLMKRWLKRCLKLDYGNVSGVLDHHPPTTPPSPLQTEILITATLAKVYSTSIKPCQALKLLWNIVNRCQRCPQQNLYCRLCLMVASSANHDSPVANLFSRSVSHPPREDLQFLALKSFQYDVRTKRFYGTDCGHCPCADVQFVHNAESILSMNRSIKFD